MTRRNSSGFFDSDRDVAALVYAAGEDPDALLQEFTRDHPALLVLDHFGAAELAALVDAASRDIPVLIAVPEARFPDWLDFTAGLAVRLPCSRSGLERWWHSLGAVPPPRQTLCERLK